MYLQKSWRKITGNVEETNQALVSIEDLAATCTDMFVRRDQEFVGTISPVELATSHAADVSPLPPGGVVTREEVKTAIRGGARNKGAGPDKVTNEALQASLPLLATLFTLAMFYSTNLITHNIIIIITCQHLYRKI